MTDTSFDVAAARLLAEQARAHWHDEWYCADIDKVCAQLIAACAELEQARAAWQAEHTAWVRTNEQLNMERREHDAALAEVERLRAENAAHVLDMARLADALDPLRAMPEIE